MFYIPDTVNKLDKNKVYDQETSGEFREVHPKAMEIGIVVVANMNIRQNVIYH